MALLTTTTSTAHGTVLPAAQAVSASDTFTNITERTQIIVNNGGGAPITVTFVTSGAAEVSDTVNYPIADDAQTVTNGTAKVFGPFKKRILNPSADTVTVTFSSLTSVTAQVIELGSA